MDPRVLDKMLPYLSEQYGNPHSRTHAYGWEAEGAVEEAREHVANLIGSQAKDVVFTSGATESNNMIIKGIAKFHQSKRRHIITTQTVGQLLESADGRNTNVSSIHVATYPPKVSMSLTFPFYPTVSSLSINSANLSVQIPLSSPSWPSTMKSG